MTDACVKCLDALQRASSSNPVRNDLSDELRAHLDQCEACQAAAAVFATGPVPEEQGAAREGPPEAALALLRRRGAARSYWTDIATLLALHWLTVGAILVVIGHGALVRNPEASLPFGSTLAAVFAMSALSAWASLAPRPPPLASLLVAAATLSGGMLLWGTDLGGWAPHQFALSCAKTEVAAAILPGAAALLLTARFTARPSHLLAAGLFTSSVGLLLLHLHCPSRAFVHLLLGHLLPGLGVAGLVIFARRAIRPASFAP